MTGPSPGIGCPAVQLVEDREESRVLLDAVRDLTSELIHFVEHALPDHARRGNHDAAEIYSVATKKDQAKKVLTEAINMVNDHALGLLAKPFGEYNRALPDLLVEIIRGIRVRLLGAPGRPQEAAERPLFCGHGLHFRGPRLGF